MARALLIVSLAVIACAGARAATSAPAADTELTLTMDDGVKLACGYRAAPRPPAPGIVLFHGIGGRHEDLDQIAQTFNGGNYATLACDARGQGASGGFFDLDGPRTTADARAQLQWLAARPGVDAAHIGAWGISLGGGAVLNSAAAGVPWSAIEVLQTWSDLDSSLEPNGLAKSGPLVLFYDDIPEGARTDDLAVAFKAALAGANRAAVLEYAEPRSSLSALGTVKAPTFLFQGRRDFVFDIGQASAAFDALRVPKRLYVGDFGHAPSTFPGPDILYVLTQGVAWFDRWLKGAPTTVQTAVAVAHDPWDQSPSRYEALPQTRLVRFAWRRRSTIGAHGKVVRTARLPRTKLETFGAPVVRARLSGSFSHVVAVVEAGGTIVSEGGAATRLSAKPRWVRIPLVSDATRLPTRARLKVTIAATSTAQSPSNALYVVDVGDGQRLKVGAVTLTLPVLRQPISR